MFEGTATLTWPRKTLIPDPDVQVRGNTGLPALLIDLEEFKAKTFFFNIFL